MAAPRTVSIRTVVSLSVAALLLPLLLVHIVPTDTVEPYVFRAQPAEYLGESGNGYLQYYRVDVLEGTAPTSSIVAALDRNYSRGYAPDKLAAGGDCWFQGSLMTPDIFYGEQYLFFGLQQVYVRQVKTGVLWPDQWTGMRVLFLSPLESLAAPLQIPFLIRSDSFTWGMLAILLARCGLIAATVAAVARKKLRGRRLAVACLLFVMAAMLLTMPVLGDLY